MQKFQKDLRRIYRKYKQQIVPVAFFFASVIILSRVVMPQLSAISDINNKIEREKKDIQQTKETLALLQTTPENILDQYFKNTTNALPLQKDIGLIYTGLSNSADKANVSLEKFSFKVGSVFDSSNTTLGGKAIEGIPYLSIEVQTKGSSTNLKEFVDVLYSAMPIVDVESFQIRDNSGRYSIKMFFKPVDNMRTDKTVNPDLIGVNVSKLSAAEAKTLEILEGWKNSIQP